MSATVPAARSTNAGDLVRVEAIDTLSGLEAQAPAWDALAARCARRGTFAATFAWFASFVEHRWQGRPWGCLFAHDGAGLAGVLPYVRHPHRLLRGRRPWLHVPGDVHTTGGDVLLVAADGADGSRAAAALAALVDAALGSRPRPVGLRLGGLLPDSPALGWLRRRRGATVEPEDLAGRAVPLRDDTWEAWHATLGANLRRNLRKARNRLHRAGALTLRRDDDPARLARFLELEAAGWKGAGGGAVAAAPEQVAFYRALCERLAARGWLEWHFLELDGRPLAGALAIRWGTQLVLQRVAYDESQARLSPGQVLLAEMLERWFADEELTCVDCLTDQPWHETWRMERTPYHRARVRGPGPIALVAGEVPQRARALLRKIGPLRRLVRRLRGEDPR